MAAKNISEIYGRYKGEDIYVIGSGWSMDEFPMSFFDGKITIGLNMMYAMYKFTYLCIHHHCYAQHVIDSGNTLVTSEYETCFKSKGKLHKFNGDYYWYKHLEQSYSSFVLFPGDDQPKDSLVTGGAVTMSAISLAEHLGARSIILCGVDGMSMGDRVHVSGYYVNPNATKAVQKKHMVNVQGMIMSYVNHLRGKGIPVVGISPFVNFMEYEDYKVAHGNDKANDSHHLVTKH